MPVSATKRFTFEAAHQLPGHEGACQYLHGHTYVLEVTAARVDGGTIEIGPSQGMVIDFSELKVIVKKHIIDRLDHSCLNDVLPYRPTAENMAIAFLEELNDHLHTINITRVRLWETQDSYAEATL